MKVAFRPIVPCGGRWECVDCKKIFQPVTDSSDFIEASAGQQSAIQAQRENDMSVEINLSCNADARDWAKSFCTTFERLNYHVGTPCGVLSINEFESWMISWFANAMMAQSDFERQREARKAENVCRGCNGHGMVGKPPYDDAEECPFCGGLGQEGNQKAMHDEQSRWTTTDRPHGYLDKGGFSHE